MSGPTQGTFATALNCMDGRVQLSINRAARLLFGVSYVDTITEAGVVRFLSDELEARETHAALSSIRISLERHGSRSIAVAAHHDCAGNPQSDTAQQEQLRRAVAFLRSQFTGCRVAGLWVGDDWTAQIVVPP